MNIEFTQEEIKVLKVILDNAYQSVENVRNLSHNVDYPIEVDDFENRIWSIKDKIDEVY